MDKRFEILPPAWVENYLKQVAAGKIPYPRFDTEYGPGIPYRKEVKKLCYEIWAFQAGRNAAQAERILHYMLTHDQHYLVGDYELNSWDEIKATTIRGWAKRFDWESKANQDIANIAPQIREVVFRELGLAAIPALETVRGIMHTSTDDTAKGDAVRLKAALGLLDRAGYGARSEPPPSFRGKDEQLSAEQIAKLSPTELLALDAKLRETDPT